MHELCRSVGLLLSVGLSTSLGCGKSNMEQDKPKPTRAIINATMMRDVEPGTKATVSDLSKVNDLRKFFIPDSAKGHERTPVIYLGYITFVYSDGSEQSFNFGVSEWSEFESQIEYPLSRDFHTLIQELIHESIRNKPQHKNEVQN